MNNLSVAAPDATTTPPQTESTALLMRLLVSTAVGGLVFTLLMGLAAALCLLVDFSPYFPYVSVVVAAVAAFVAGYCNVHVQRRNGLLLGLLAAAALYVGLLLVAMVLTKGKLGFNAVITLLSMLAGGAVGGIFAANHVPAQGRQSLRGNKRKRSQ